MFKRASGVAARSRLRSTLRDSKQDKIRQLSAPKSRGDLIAAGRPDPGFIRKRPSDPLWGSIRPLEAYGSAGDTLSCEGFREEFSVVGGLGVRRAASIRKVPKRASVMVAASLLKQDQFGHDDIS